jgi:hypothetical protein
VDEAENLLDSNAEVCVRAQIQPSGAVRLKPGIKPGARRMIVALGTSMGLAAATVQPAFAEDSKKAPTGAIEGIIEKGGYGVTVTLIGPDGKKRKVKVRDNRYVITKLKPGSYRLEFRERCYSTGSKLRVFEDENVLVESGQTTVNTNHRVVEDWGEGCPIIVGMIKVKRAQG